MPNLTSNYSTFTELQPDKYQEFERQSEEKAEREYLRIIEDIQSFSNVTISELSDTDRRLLIASGVKIKESVADVFIQNNLS